MCPPGDGDFDFRQYSSPTTPTPSPLSEASSGSSTDYTASYLDDDGDDAVASSSSDGPPFAVLFIALAIAVAGVVLAVLAGQNVPLAWAGWALAGPVAVGAFAVFTLRDTKQRAKPFYGERGSAVWLYRLGLLIALVGIVFGALRLADWAGRW